MKLKITQDKPVREIQKEFKKHFPFLKLEFYLVAHAIGKATPKRLIRNGNKTIRDCRTTLNAGVTTITENMTVAKVEQMFQYKFGLSVQVFRKSGNEWLQTTASDSWTLLVQNNLAKEMSISVPEEIKEIELGVRD